MTDHLVGQPDTAPRADDATKAYRLLVRRRTVVVLCLFVLTAALFITDIGIGASGLSVSQLLHGIFQPWDTTESIHQIIWNIRMPMSVVGVLVGASLAIAGVEMQTILNNPLAEPYTLGIAAAAGFGAAFSVVVGFSAVTFLGTAGSAWVFAMIACGVILAFSRVRGANTETMVLLGIAQVFLFTALLSLMQYIASDAQLQQVVFWTLGSLSRATWQQVILLAVCVAVVTPMFFRASWTLTTFRLGEERARAMGVNVERTRVLVLIGVSLLAATAVSVAGTIGFVGLVGPHAARILVGENQRHFLPAAALCGATLLCGASVASKLITPGVIVPVGIITSIVGVPLFLALILTRTRRQWV